MYYCYNSRLNNYSAQRRNKLMYFQLEVDYYSNEANKNKYTSFQLIVSTKTTSKQLKIRMYRALYLQRHLVIPCCLDSKVLCYLDLLLLGSIFFKWMLCLFEQGISRSIFILILYTQIKTNKVIHNVGSQVYPLFFTNMGVSPLHGFIVASLSHIYTITIPQAKFPYPLTVSIYKSSLVLVNVISCILIPFA